LSAVAAPARVDLCSRFDLETSGGRVPVFFVVYVLGPGWFTSNGLGAALIATMVALVASLILAGVLFLIAERPYFAAQRRKHA
jgi:hypothetical protein